MAVTLIPPGPNANPQAVLKALYDAVSELQNPGAPVQLASVDLKVASPPQTGLPPAANWPNGAIICAEINSVVVSTLVTGAYAWLRADGSAL